MTFDPVAAILLTPLIAAAVLAVLPGYRLEAGLNMIASLASLLFALTLLWHRPATGAQGMPLVVEISVAFSVLIAFIVIGIFLFRIRERFDTVDVEALDQFRGERG